MPCSDFTRFRLENPLQLTFDGGPCRRVHATPPFLDEAQPFPGEDRVHAGVVRGEGAKVQRDGLRVGTCDRARGAFGEAALLDPVERGAGECQERRDTSG